MRPPFNTWPQALLQHDLAKHDGMPQHEQVFRKLIAQEQRAEKTALSQMTVEALSDKIDNLAELLAIHMESEHKMYLTKYLQTQVETGHTKCCFCERS